ncbi:MAG TPA: hypothetical protein VK901_09335 [Nitrospiraceae bacterium]|nr:hypothetical protein [Nitrospiraceae bacterium]
MTQLAHLSPIQYVHQPDGRITLEGLPNVAVQVIAEQGAVQGRDWQRELGLPTYHEEWEAMARPRSLTSGRTIRFVLMDESQTRFPGHPRLQPHRVMLPYPMRCPLTLSHTGFVVGTVYSFLLISEQDHEALKRMAIDLPDFTEGQWILSEAELFSSALADKAWQGLQEQIFSHTCPVLLAKPGEPIGAGELIEVALTPGDYPGCPGARVLKTWMA